MLPALASCTGAGRTGDAADWPVSPARSRDSMQSDPPCVLAINAGSSSIRFAVYEVADPLRRRLDGHIERVGLSGSALTVTDRAGQSCHQTVGARDAHAAAGGLMDWLQGEPPVWSSA